MAVADCSSDDAVSVAPLPKRTKLSSSTYSSSEPSPTEATTTSGESSPAHVINGSNNAASDVSTGFEPCLDLLRALADSTVPSVPPSILSKGRARDDLVKTRALFDDHGFRTSVVTSPRPALSIYMDSCRLDDGDEQRATATTAMGPLANGKEFLLSMLGMHPHQSSMERWYSSSTKALYCLLLFCHRIRAACSKAVDSSNDAKQMLERCENLVRSVPLAAMPTAAAESSSSPTSVATSPTPMEHANRISSIASERVAELIAAVIKADPRLRAEQLQHEYDRIAVHNSTFANAIVQLYLDVNGTTIKDVYYKRCHDLKFARITVYLYDPELDLLKPPRFAFLPSLRRALDDGPEAVVDDILYAFWKHLLRAGYFVTDKIKEDMTMPLKKFFLSGLVDDLTVPLLLNAHFTPMYPLSFYFHGKAGAGKSSLVRNFSPALNAAIEETVDPEILVRFVKQNLNKPYRDLELELELRPNNNDLSVMSIIQGRRMTLTQTKPGLVVVGLEEMPSNVADADPNQLKAAHLISQRFSGRNGDFNAKANAPRNSAKRGISGDATLLSLFTSNYELEIPCVEALRRLDMFKNLKTIETKPVSGSARVEFARSYVTSIISDHFLDRGVDCECEVELQIPVGNGDTRPLVRHLRMVAFFVCALAKEEAAVGSPFNARVTHDDDSNITSVTCAEKTVQLKLGSFENLFPLTPQVFDSRANEAVEVLKESLGSPRDYADLSQILDFYFAKTLAPAVIVSQNEKLIKNLVAAVAAQDDVHSIVGVDAANYKMMKSLYDPNDTPNLRDDILAHGKGANVAVELQCQTADSQLCIREIIEDSPSMTAFSTNKSALYKAGLLFGVYVSGDITPEVRSRASLIL